MITQERLKEVLFYSPKTGTFIWRVTLNPRGKAGSVAGCKDGAYWAIRIDRTLYDAHRLAWLYMTGEWPEGIDHRDKDGINNRWKNLREADQSQNGANSRLRVNSATGYKGVYLRRGKYV